MNCLRCGREIEDDCAFCDHCLQSMEKYPVRPGTAIILPKHKEAPVQKKIKHHLPVSSAEQIRNLRKQRFLLILISLMLAFLLAGTVFMQLRLQNMIHYRPGQNYSAVETTAPAE